MTPAVVKGSVTPNQASSQLPDEPRPPEGEDERDAADDRREDERDGDERAEQPRAAALGAGEDPAERDADRDAEQRRGRRADEREPECVGDLGGREDARQPTPWCPQEEAEEGHEQEGDGDERRDAEGGRHPRRGRPSARRGDPRHGLVKPASRRTFCPSPDRTYPTNAAASDGFAALPRATIG